MEFFRQALFIFKLLIWLKSYRFLYCVFPIACLVSNTYLYPIISNAFAPSTESIVGLQTFGVEDFVSGSRLVADSGLLQTQALLDIVAKRQSRPSDKDSFLTDCSSKSDCDAKYLRALHSSTGSKVLSYADYEAASLLNRVMVSCLLADNSDLGCPYAVQLVAQSLSTNGTAFRNVQFFSLLSQQARQLNSGDKLTAPMPTQSQDSVCTKNNGSIYRLIFPTMLMLQMVLISTGMTFFVTLGNVSCISRLKQDGFLQLMHQNGLSVGAYWTAMWFLTVLEMLVFGGVTVLAFGLQCSIFPAESLLATFFLVVLFSIYLSALGYMFSSLIKSFFITLLLMVLVTVVHVVLILVIRLSLMGEDQNSRIARYVLIVFPFSHLGELLIRVLFEQAAITGYYLAVTIVSSLVPVLLILLSIYIDFLTPNGNGYRLPANFIFQRRFWIRSGVLNPTMQDSQMELNRLNIEPVSEGLRPRVKVRGVDKIYRKKEYPCSSLQIVAALNRISCTLYDGQITALIGHNGAGKTTLLKILIGEENPTDGKAVIDGRLVTDPLQRLTLRGHLGICHQTNVLCSDLTVMQCIELALISRGYTLPERKSEVADLLSRLDLDDKVNKKATELSGGQKRKLCTILSLIGEPKVIFLDEPTSGLDPVSRRRLWQILQEYKVGRAIVLCTQFMDEADILADRKIFLSSGSLICAGSSLFLKHAFGCGFVLNVSLKSEQVLTKLLALLRHACSSVKLQNQFRTEVELMLPASELDALPGVVRVLENQTDLVEAFGLSQATLDDIFIRLKDVNLAEIEAAFQSGQLSNFAEHQASASREAQNELQTMLKSQGSNVTSATSPEQFGALMKLNLTRLKRAKLKLCCRFIFPIILLAALIGALFLERSLPQRIIPPRQNISSQSSQTEATCIKDVEDQNYLNKTTCCQLFNCYSESRMVVLNKSRSTDISSFLTQPDTLSALNGTCILHYSCPIVYSTSWNQAENNNSNRTLYVGVFSNQYSPFQESKIAQLLDSYSSLATYFGLGSIRNFVFPVGIRSYQTSVYPVMGIFIFVFIFSIIPVTYISDPLEDKDSKVRYHLRSMGMRSIGYWFNTFLLHWCQYAVFVLLSAILFAAIIPRNYGNAFFIAGAGLPCLFIGCASNQLWVYSIGMLLKKPNPIVTVIYFFIAMWLSSAVSAVQFSYLASIITIWLLPPFATVSLVFFVVKLSIYAMSYYNLDNISDIPNQASVYFSNPYVLHSLIAVIAHIVLLIAFIAMMENRSEIASACGRALRRKTNIQQQMLNQSSDAGVKQEIERIGQSNRSRQNVLEVKSLEKKYDNGVLAVKGVSFGAISGEIFGLLGPNGAGKTTTLAVVVGEEVATGGSCEVCSHDIWMSGSDGATNGAVGYCPQHNPLFDSITVMEHLEFYSRIRGVPKNVAAKQIPNLVNGLGLSEHRDKQAEQLSGGNKRRLCLAISLLGNPSLVVIDEASTGVDPEAKRLIWSAIRGMANDQRSVVVTTHSMEEVEALCSRVGIMNHGYMIAFGTIQQLRSRYGHAYTLDILLNVTSDLQPSQVRDKMRRVINAVMEKFPHCKISEELSNRVQFLVPQDSIGSSLSDALAWLTENQAALSIQYFTFYQMSLDQVFVRLIKEHEDVKGKDNTAFRSIEDL